MKTRELFEVKEKVEWVADEDAAFHLLLKRLSLRYRKKPFMYKDRWSFGGEIFDTEKQEITLPLEKRLVGAQKAVAKHLFDLHKSGREVVVYQPARYDYMRGKAGVWALSPSEFTSRLIYADDTLPAVESLVKDRMQKNTTVDGKYSIVFQYGVSDPKPLEDKKESAKKAYRVVKGPAK